MKGCNKKRSLVAAAARRRDAVLRARRRAQTKSHRRQPVRSGKTNIVWNDARISLLRKLFVEDGLPGSRVAVKFGTTRSAIMGKLDRLGIKRGPAKAVSIVEGPPIRVARTQPVVPAPPLVVSPPPAPTSSGEYRPSESEPFMDERQLDHFRAKLQAWKADVMAAMRDTAQHLKDTNTEQGDEVDVASARADRELELRARERQLRLIGKIDAALARIEDGSYGYCEETGEPISLQRLEARPIATLSFEAQERHERLERSGRAKSAERELVKFG